MGIQNQQKVHKKLSYYEDRLEDLQTGVILLCRGGIAILATIFVVIAFLDQIRCRPFELEWLQILGLGLCGAAFVFCYVIMKIVKDEKTGW
jgi:hypothetical protein